MANTITSLNPAIWRPIVQDFLNNILISKEISNTKFEADLVDGSSINFPYMSDVRVQDYAQGTDLTIDALNATQSTLTINQSKAVAIPIDPVQERQARAKFATTMAMQSAYQLANNIDQYAIGQGVTNASSVNTITGGTLNTSNMYSTVTTAYSKLFRANATDGPMFGVVDAERLALLSQSFVANGFAQADSLLQNSFVGKTVNGFDIYISNNLPCSQTVTIAATPTATNNVNAYGVTWTFVANGTATNPGEISLGTGGSALADTQANFKAAINGTGTPGASTYIDVSVDNRRIYQSQQVAASSFDTNVCTITAYGKIGMTAVFTSGSNTVGTETTSLLFGRKGAISLGLQMLPNLYIREEPKQLTRNFISHTLYGSTVFTRDAKRLCKVTCNM